MHFCPQILSFFHGQSDVMSPVDWLKEMSLASSKVNSRLHVSRFPLLEMEQLSAVTAFALYLSQFLTLEQEMPF